MPVLNTPPRLREQLHEVMRTKHYSLRPEKAYWYWIRYFIHFHRMRHPRDIAEPEVVELLTWLATNRNMAAATQNQALKALVFLYKQVLQQPLQQIDGISRGKKPRKHPVVVTNQEALIIISKLPSPYLLIVSLMYETAARQWAVQFMHSECGL